MSFSWGLAWKVCAFVPIVLLCAAMLVRVAGDEGESQTPTAALGDDPSAILTTPGPTPILTTASRSGKRQAAKSSQAPSPAPAGAPSEQSTPASDKPTKRPSPTKQPAPTPTPEEARERCLAEGNNAVDIAALAECIAEKMGR